MLKTFKDYEQFKESIQRYYQISPILVETINQDEKHDLIYDSIYNNIIISAINEIKAGNVIGAYDIFRQGIMILELNYGIAFPLNRDEVTLSI